MAQDPNDCLGNERVRRDAIDVSMTRDIQRMSRSKATLRDYTTKNSKFLLWAIENYEGLKELGAHEFMCEDWVKRVILQDENRRVKEVKNILANIDPINRSGLEGILHLDRLDFSAWSYFLTSIRRKNKNGGESYLKNYGNFKSALRFLFRSVGVTLPPWFDTHAKELVTALRRVSAQERGEDAGESHQVGKCSLPFPLYCAMAHELLRDGLWSAHFIHVYSWNLSARASTTCALRLSHFAWDNDCMKIYIPTQKNDQDGGKQGQYPHHVYANPNIPYICPLLSLAMFLATTERADSDGNAFFDEQAAYARHSKQMVAWKEKNVEMLRAYGLEPSDIGTHSNRKGSSTFVTSGVTDGPSIVAMCNRAGWDTGKVLSTYLRYEAAGDQYIGRIVAGLSPSSGTKFAQLPPHFLPGVDLLVLNQLLKVAFGSFTRRPLVQPVLEHCLATLLFHEAFLLHDLGQGNPLRFIPLWHDPSREHLKRFLTCDGNEDRCGNGITATGIPMNVHILSSCTSTAKSIEKLKDNLPKVVLQCLEERDVDCGNITSASIRNIFQEMIQPLMTAVTESIEGGGQRPCVHPLQEPNMLGLTRLPTAPLHIPTKISVKAAFVSYSSGQTPWKRLTNAMVDKKDRVLLADLKFIMEHIERELVKKNAWNGEVPIDPSYATRLFDLAKEHVPTKTKHGRTLMWRSACLYLRKQCKARAQEDQDGDSSPLPPS